MPVSIYIKALFAFCKNWPLYRGRDSCRWFFRDWGVVDNFLHCSIRRFFCLDDGDDFDFYQKNRRKIKIFVAWENKKQLFSFLPLIGYAYAQQCQSPDDCPPDSFCEFGFCSSLPLITTWSHWLLKWWHDSNWNYVL